MVCAVGKSREFGLTARQPNRRSIGRDRHERNASSIGIESKRADFLNLSDGINPPTWIPGSRKSAPRNDGVERC
jgi:hypothetical protein